MMNYREQSACRNGRSYRLARATWLAGLPAMCLATAAAAQTQPSVVPQETPPASASATPPTAESNATLGEIIVTARRQTERLQDVPVAVTAVGGAELDAYGLDKVQKIATRIPTLNIAPGGSGAGAAVRLRGVGSSAISAAFDSAVAIYLDDLSFSTARVVQAAYLDIGQVEVLKGPQSLFFGKSASAGVISFGSRNPGTKFEAGISGSYEFEEKGKAVEGYISGPVTDTLGVRVAARYSKADEIMHNVLPGVRNPFIGEESTDAKLTLLWKPSNTFSLNLKGSYSRYKADTAAQFSENRCATPPNPQPSVYPQVSFTINPSLYDCAYKDQRYYFADQLPAEAGQQPRNNGGAPYTDLTIKFTRLKGEWAITPDIALTSVTGYSQIHSEEFGLFSATTEGGGAGTPINDVKTFSQEIRVASKFAGPFNLQVGGYYEDRRQFFQTGQTAFGITPLVGPDPFTGNTYDYEYNQLTKAKASSAFVSASFKPVDGLTLNAGVRYTKERKRSQFKVLYSHAALAGFIAPGGSSTVVIPFRDENWSPEASVTYKFDNNVTAYAAYKTGFKSGGVDTSALPTVGTIASINACNTGAACPVRFQSEKSKGGEIGLKSELLGRTLRLNLVAYRYVFSNLQVQQFVAAETLFRTFNVGEITTKGIEADVEYITPIDGLRLGSSLAYLHGRFTKDFVSVLGANFRGRAPENSPKWAGNISADYKGNIGRDLKFELGTALSFQSDYYASSQDANRFKYKGYTLVDLRFGVGSNNDRWNISLNATNLFDNIVVFQDGPRPFALPGAPQDQMTVQNRGRQVFLRTALKF